MVHIKTEEISSKSKKEEEEKKTYIQKEKERESERFKQTTKLHKLPNSFTVINSPHSIC